MNIINFDAGLEKLQNDRLYQKWRKKRRSNVKNMKELDDEIERH
jgi:hypothetical protein